MCVLSFGLPFCFSGETAIMWHQWRVIPARLKECRDTKQRLFVGATALTDKGQERARLSQPQFSGFTGYFAAFPLGFNGMVTLGQVFEQSGPFGADGEQIHAGTSLPSALATAASMRSYAMRSAGPSSRVIAQWLATNGKA